MRVTNRRIQIPGTAQSKEIKNIIREIRVQADCGQISAQLSASAFGESPPPAHLGHSYGLRSAWFRIIASRTPALLSWIATSFVAVVT
ncbi:hypothetical protein QIH80_33965 [Bradyrhizobium elkanii]|nr:hypothetical protein QIH80_33965 [Bradyrhizobium elkanii]